MWYACRRPDSNTRRGMVRFAPDREGAAPFDDEVELILIGVGMHGLCLAGLQAVEAEQQVCALEQRGLEELLGLHASVVAVISEPVHNASSSLGRCRMGNFLPADLAMFAEVDLAAYERAGRGA